MEEVDGKIKYLTAPANMIISGATGSGKTTTITRNCHYIIIMKTPHLNTLSVLGTQLLGRGEILKEIYLKVMHEKTFNYLIIDVFSNDYKNKLQSNILKENGSPLTIWRFH